MTGLTVMFGMTAMYRLDWTKQAIKDSINIDRANLRRQVMDIMGIIERNPYKPAPGDDFEKLVSYPNGTYSRRINKHHRFIYNIQPNTNGYKDENGNLYDGIIRIVSMWGHP